MRIPLVLAAFLLVSFRAVAAEEVVSAPAFAQAVKAAGGAVDFVFEDERPFAQCHASTIVQTKNGDLLCAWFGGKEEADPGVGIWWSRYAGGVWAAPALAAKVKEEAHWNPVLFRDKDERLYLFFKVGVDVPHWSTWWMSSVDDGTTWSAPVELVPGDVGGRGPVKDKPIVLSDGAWLAPASIEEPGKHGRWRPFADRSEDGGKTWVRSAEWAIDASRKKLKGPGAIQPTFWESAPGKVSALMRSGYGRIWRTESEDYGKTWSPVAVTELPNNNSGIDALRLEDGRVLLVYNPVGMNWGPRTPLDLAISEDNGVHFRSIAHLEDNPDKRSEFSYPAMVRTKTGVAISYTWQRQRVRAWQIPFELLK